MQELQSLRIPSPNDVLPKRVLVEGLTRQLLRRKSRFHLDSDQPDSLDSNLDDPHDADRSLQNRSVVSHYSHGFNVSPEFPRQTTACQCKKTKSGSLLAKPTCPASGNPEDPANPGNSPCPCTRNSLIFVSVFFRLCVFHNTLSF